MERELLETKVVQHAIKHLPKGNMTCKDDLIMADDKLYKLILSVDKQLLSGFQTFLAGNQLYEL